ncbi:MAG: rhomboid family intramembrane serine protease [Syntrophobacteraceae bacterium]|nr:rhomboid family intramembrane serine protease [Syntrophobacteraceae bacterium]
MGSEERRSILCPNCRKLISIDQSPCPYCGLRNPGSRWKHNPWTRGLMDGDQFVRSVIVLSGVMFVLSIIMSPGSTRFSMNPLDFLSPGNRSLLLLGATGRIPIDQFHRWWSLLSANFLHGSILHLLFNMIALRQIAPLVFQEYGGHRTISIFILSGVGGYLVSYLAGIAFTLGASAAVCGLIGAALYFGRSRGGHFGPAVYQQVGGWAVGILIFGFLIPGINNWAHGGGFISGVVLGYALGYHEKKAESLHHKAIAGVCALAALGSLFWAVGSSFFILLQTR